jgi:cobyrinic acid a,c-diamide synthase
MAIIIGLSSLNDEAKINGVIPDTVTSWECGGPARRT